MGDTSYPDFVVGEAITRRRSTEFRISDMHTMKRTRAYTSSYVPSHSSLRHMSQTYFGLRHMRHILVCDI